MQFLNSTTLEQIVGQTVTVVVDTKTITIPTITAKAFLRDGNLFIDCVPALPGKYVVAVPKNAIISSADRPDKGWKFGIFTTPETDAGKLIKGLVDAKLISHN